MLNKTFGLSLGPNPTRILVVPKNMILKGDLKSVLNLANFNTKSPGIMRVVKPPIVDQKKTKEVNQQRVTLKRTFPISDVSGKIN